ncbi:hypothetical protein FKW77_010783 [Venturia effusa]|uniref:Uncharacterized protein n=1 Tax=Venturia effusa TaxID=50376 RepID=A0A517KYF8_9PEZI|nr:hypothetical protein FKW77_010783 [Venturia effusa]
MSTAANGNGKYGDYKTQTLENVSSTDYRVAPPTRQSKIKANLRKYWWLHLSSFIIGTVLVNILIIYVGMPNIAQKGIDDSKLYLKSQVVTNPRSGAVHVRMVTDAENKNIFKPTLDEFKAALFLENTLPDIKPFGYVTIPRLHAGSLETITIDQELEIADPQQFALYNIAVLNSETYRVAIRGRTNLHLGAFPVVKVNFNKVITSKGLNKLHGFQVRDIKLSLTPEKDGTNMQGTVFLPNPSPMTIQMGTVVQDVYVGDKKIGVTTIPDLTLKPGDNFIPMKTTADQVVVIELITSKYKDGKLPVTIKGNSSTSLQGQKLDYFTAALRSNDMQATLDLKEPLKEIGVDISGL